MRFTFDKFPLFIVFHISMGWCEKDVTPLLTHWRYLFRVQTYRYAQLVANYVIPHHYNDVIMSAMVSQITSLTIAFVWGIHRWPVDSPHKGPVTRKMFPFDDVIMLQPGVVISQQVMKELTFDMENVINLCDHNDGLVQDCSNSSALATELLQSCTESSTCILEKIGRVITGSYYMYGGLSQTGMIMPEPLMVIRRITVFK